MQLIDELWQKRWNQDIEGVLHFLPTLQDWTRVEPKDFEQSILRLNAQLLTISLMRARGKMDQYHSSLQELEQNTNPDVLKSSRYFWFERGISAYIKNDFLSGLENFVKHRSLAHQDAEKAISLINEVFCLSNLGFPFQQSLEKLDEILGESQQDQKPPLSIVRAQRRYLDYANRFENGSTNFITEEKSKPTDTQFDQARFFSLWAASLPYHLNYDPEFAKQIIAAFSSNPYFFQKNYRAKTLIENVHLKEDEMVKLADLAERLYLWTWRWMVRPSVASANLVLIALNDLVKSYRREELTIYNISLIRNSINWITLLAPSLETNLKTWIKEIRSQDLSAQSPLYDYEGLVIQALRRSPANDMGMMGAMEIVLRQHPIHKKEQIQFSYLVDGVQSTWSAPILSSLSAIHQPKTLPSGTSVWVNPDHFTIQTKKETIISEPIARAFKTLSHQNTLPIPQFVRDVFGIQSYDEFIHGPKLHNLLSRIRVLLPKTMKLVVKSGVLYFTGDLSRLNVSSENPHSQSLKDSRHWFELSDIRDQNLSAEAQAQLPSSRKIEKLAIAHFEKSFTRRELHQHLGGSRASMIRRINEMISSGKIIRNGKGKNTVYILKKEDAFYEKH